MLINDEPEAGGRKPRRWGGHVWLPASASGLTRFTFRWHPVSAAAPRARRSRTRRATSSGRWHSCQSSLTPTTGARSHAPRHSTSTSVNCRAASVSPWPDAERLGEGLGHALGAHERARQRPADLHDMAPDRPRVEHRVERHDVLDLGGRAADRLGHVPHGVAREIALLPLREVQRRQNRRFPLIGRVPGEDRVEPRPVLGCEGERRTFLRQRAAGLVMPAAVVHRGMETHERPLDRCVLTGRRLP